MRDMTDKLLGLLVGGVMLAIASTISAAPKRMTDVVPTMAGTQWVTTGIPQLAPVQAASAYIVLRTVTCSTVNYTSSCTVIDGAVISLSNTGPLEFGSIAPSQSAGTVTVTPVGVRRAVNVGLIAGSTGAAGFTITGKTGQTYAISLPSSTTLTSGTNSLTLETFTEDRGTTPTLVGGSDTFKVGGTLHVGANQAAGTYVGAISVTVHYD